MRMKLFMKVLKAVNAILSKFNLDPIDPAEFYAEETRQTFRKLYEEGRIDWMPEKITARIDDDGEVIIHIEPLPPIIMATLNFTYDPKNDTIDSPPEKP